MEKFKCYENGNIHAGGYNFCYIWRLHASSGTGLFRYNDKNNNRFIETGGYLPVPIRVEDMYKDNGMHLISDIYTYVYTLR